MGDRQVAAMSGSLLAPLEGRHITVTLTYKAGALKQGIIPSSYHVLNMT